MSGHSKWAQIKRQKGVADIRRGMLFSKLTNMITAAAKVGGIDSSANLRLRLAIEQARAANMPKENIERAIQRAKGPEAGKLEEILYEALGPEGTAFLIAATTDNRNRTTQEIRSVLSRHGGKLASTGAVSYLFEQRGVLRVDAPAEKQDEIVSRAIDAGAADFDQTEDFVLIYTEPQSLEKVKQSLISQGISVAESFLSWEPKNTVKITDTASAKKLLEMSDSLEALDEVSQVFANYDISEEILQKESMESAKR